MNSTNNASSDSSDQLIISRVKATTNLIAFITTTTFMCLIVQTVWQHLDLRKEIRHMLLCHHLICIAVYFGLGFLFYGIRTLKLNAPVLLCWITFAVQTAFGRGILLTLTLMAVNTCITICWPLRYLSFVHAVGRKVMALLWFLAVINPIWSTIYELQESHPGYVYERDPSCPTSLGRLAPRIGGGIFIFTLVIIIGLSYCFIYREGKQSGHFNHSNIRARRTILIHTLQLSFHIIPVFILIVARKRLSPTSEIASYIIFSVAQSLSPVIYGFRCKEIRNKMKWMDSNSCLYSKMERTSFAMSRLNQSVASVINDDHLNSSSASAP
ncbi:uncharacterized protein LOC122801593 [Protopterus annectens]|uniref:uncharacterized protein LOC122801593 n=1 Tax=Protopterus annectens TaxID=7888 RepID=UPI001CFA8D7E|nr:uncharacterized protein LOC122801593 [Protopterus annectens]